MERRPARAADRPGMERAAAPVGRALPPRPEPGGSVSRPTRAAALVGGLGLAVAAGSLVRTVPLNPVDADPLAYVEPSRGGHGPGARADPDRRAGRPPGEGVPPCDATERPRPVSRRRGGRREAVAPGRGPEHHRRREPCRARGPALSRRAAVTRSGPAARAERTPNRAGRSGSHSLPIAPLWSEALSRLNVSKAPAAKGVKGLMSPGKVPEPIEKGILRAVAPDLRLPGRHGAVRPHQPSRSPIFGRRRSVPTFRPFDGSGTRTTDRRRAHRPRAARRAPSPGPRGRAVLRDLSHATRPVRRRRARPALLAGAPFYRAERPVGPRRGPGGSARAAHLGRGRRTDSSGSRTAEACFAHPVFHAAKRRNCDGDEDSVTLLLDALLNFSRAYLPDTRGRADGQAPGAHDPARGDRGRQGGPQRRRREPLPARPLPRRGRGQAPEGDRPGSTSWASGSGPPRSLSGYGFTHDTRRIAGGPVRSAYRDGRSMADLVERSVLLTTQIRAVDVAAGGRARPERALPARRDGEPQGVRDAEVPLPACGDDLPSPAAHGALHRPRPPEEARARASSSRASTKPPSGNTSRSSQRLGEMEGITPYVRQRIRVLADALDALFPGVDRADDARRVRAVRRAPVSARGAAP